MKYTRLKTPETYLTYHDQPMLMNMSEVIHNPNAILRRINEMERELEELRVIVLKMKAESLPVEKVDEETLKAFEKDLKDMIEGRVETISGDEAVKMLSELLDE